MASSRYKWPKEPRHLDITDLERIERYRRAGYGGSVSDSLTAWASTIRSSAASSRRCARACSLSAAPCPSSSTLSAR